MSEHTFIIELPGGAPSDVRLMSEREYVKHTIETVRGANLLLLTDIRDLSSVTAEEAIDEIGDVIEWANILADEVERLWALQAEAREAVTEIVQAVQKEENQ